MKAPARHPPRRAAPRHGLWAAALGGSAALHAAALAALLFASGRDAAEAPGIPEGVALVFEDTAARGGVPDQEPEGTPPPAPAPAEEEAPAASPPTEPAPPQAAAPVPPPPEPTPAPAEAGPPADPPAALPPAEAPEELPAPPLAAEQPPEPAAAPTDAPEPPLPEPPPPPPPERLATPAPPSSPRPPPRPTRPADDTVRLNAGSAALPDPSLGARALGAVTPPAAAPGERNAPPGYPAESRRRGEEGVVRLSLHIGSDGRVERAEIAESSGFPALDSAALEAARRWRFRPAMQAGLPVAATLNTAVQFRLTQAERR